ncbi:MAG: hypothetical protein EKE20_11720 [Candidatus Symbiopectobacterium sp. Dall1.0]|nr:hypothetical protein [Candidatus Symbiopectobacterium sp. Dall1.0]
MPISAIQHRLSTAGYCDKSPKIKHEKALESINSHPSVSIHDFSSKISHVENSPRILNPSLTPLFARRSAMAKTIQLMLLFNFLHRSDSVSFAYKENVLSIMDNDTALAKRNYFIEKIQFLCLLLTTDMFPLSPYGCQKESWEGYHMLIAIT